MANKTITELQLISSVTDDVNVPGDNGIQTYRLTAAQLKAYILANGNITLSMLDDDIFNGLTEVTPAADDEFIFADTSDGNKTKKGLVGTFVQNVYRSISTYPATVTVADASMKLSGSSGTLTLPTAVGIAGKRFKFVHLGTSFSNVYTFATTSAQTISGDASGAVKMYTKWEVLELESDGANWIVFSRHVPMSTQFCSYSLANQVIANGAVALYDTLIQDDDGLFNTTTGEFTTKKADLYAINFTLTSVARQIQPVPQVDRGAGFVSLATSLYTVGATASGGGINFLWLDVGHKLRVINGNGSTELTNNSQTENLLQIIGLGK